MGGTAEIRSRVAALAERIGEGLVERDEPARLVLLAALSGEHSLLLGPPGTAKSRLARRLRACFGGVFFERLLTRFSVPEELFGPLSIRSLERDEYVRLTSGYLPSASVAFLDEIFKANSAILNALLTLLNEREFDNGAERVRTPLVSVVAASNEVPDEPELAALYDRFLVRCHVTPVSTESFDALLSCPDDDSLDRFADLALTPADLARVREGARAVRVPAAVRALLATIREDLAEEKVVVSDRRWVKIAGLLRTAAFTDGREEVSLSDCGLVVHCVWSTPDHFAAVHDIVRGVMAEVLEREPHRLAGLTHELEAAAHEDRQRTIQAIDADGRLLFLDERGRKATVAFSRKSRTTRDGDPLYRPPPEMQDTHGRDAFTVAELWDRHFSTLPHGMAALDRWTKDDLHEVFERVEREPVLEPARYSAEHVEGRLHQAEKVAADARSLARAIEERLEGPSSSLWPVGTIGAEWAERLRAAHAVVAPLAKRVEEVCAIYRALPIDLP